MTQFHPAHVERGRVRGHLGRVPDEHELGLRVEEPTRSTTRRRPGRCACRARVTHLIGLASSCLAGRRPARRPRAGPRRVPAGEVVAPADLAELAAQPAHRVPPGTFVDAARTAPDRPRRGTPPPGPAIPPPARARLCRPPGSGLPDGGAPPFSTTSSASHSRMLAGAGVGGQRDDAVGELGDPEPLELAPHRDAGGRRLPRHPVGQQHPGARAVTVRARHPRPRPPGATAPATR